MKTQYALGTGLLFIVVALTGCFGGGNGGESTDPNELDENAAYDHAIANDGFQVQGGVATGTPVALGDTPAQGNPASAAELEVVDQVSTDADVTAEGNADKADFLMDAQPEGGQRMQALLRSVIGGNMLGLDADYQGGVAQNVNVFGSTDIGPAEFPETKAYILLLGQVRLQADGQRIDGQHTAVVAVTKAVHDEGGALMTEAADDRLEMHVYMPGRTLGPDFAIPGTPDESLYFFFTNVQLKQLGVNAKADIGDGLGAPEIPNEAPTAVAQVLVGGVAADNATLDLQANDGNVTLTLDGGNSTDADGEIQIYSWEVRAFKNNTSIEKIFSGQGSTVDLNISTPGWKLITLRVIDDRFEPAEDTVLFFVNYANQYSHTFGDANIIGVPNPAGENCNPPINCQEHSLTVQFGAQEATFERSTDDGQCLSPHLELYAPGPTPGEDGEMVGSAEGDTLTVAGTELTAIGQYKLIVWYEQQASCSYSVTADVSYTNPQVE